MILSSLIYSSEPWFPHLKNRQNASLFSERIKRMHM